MKNHSFSQIEDKLESEEKKTLTEEQKSFVNRTADALEELKKRLVAVEVKLDLTGIMSNFTNN